MDARLRGHDDSDDPNKKATPKRRLKCTSHRTGWSYSTAWG